MGEWTYKNTNVAEAEELLLSQFDGSTRLHGLVQTVGARAQTLEDVDAELYAAFDPATAVGAQLTTLGDIVQELRKSREDIPYRAWITARIAANNSEGHADELLHIVRLLLGIEGGHTLDFKVYPPAAFLIEQRGEALAYFWDDTTDPEDVAAAIADILEEAAAGGVRVGFLYQPQDDANMFTLSSSTGIETSAARGLAPNNQSTGGHLAGLETR